MLSPPVDAAVTQSRICIQGIGVKDAITNVSRAIPLY
jgi:hypothetical protein